MLHSYKNIKLLLDDNEVVAQNLQLASFNSLDFQYLAGDKFPVGQSPTLGVQGSLKVSYYLTGNDVLKGLIENETRSVSGNIAGLEIQSGYLKSYSINGKANTPALVNSEIVFFDELKGSIQPTYETFVEEKDILNFSDAIIATESRNEIESFSNNNIISYSYSYGINLQPIYAIDNREELRNLLPCDISFGKKSVSTDLVVDSKVAELSMSGDPVNLSLTLKGGNNPFISEEFLTLGFLKQRSFGVSVNNLLSTSLSVSQETIGKNPEIFGFSPLSGAPESFVVISGSNLENTLSILFSDAPSNSFTIISDSLLSGQVPLNAIDGKIKVNTFVGSKASEEEFDVLEPGITVEGFSPTTGITDSRIIITGENFYRIDSVLFHSGLQESNNWSVISPTTIEAYVPAQALWGEIHVSSSLRGQTGISPEKYIPFPIINSFSPRTGICGDIITLSGEGLGDAVYFGATSPTFNNLTATITGTTDDTVSLVTPCAGNINGLIRVSVPNGMSALSPFPFEASVAITGLNPFSGETGDSIDIQGLNFDSDLMFQGGGGDYLVSFNGAVGGFDILSSSLLTGNIPEGATSGPVRILTPDESAYPSSFDFTLKNISPIINSISPEIASEGDIVYVNGSGLQETFSLIITGDATSGTLDGHIFSPVDYAVDVFGEIISFDLPSGLDTGFYNIYAETPIGFDTSDSNFEVAIALMPTTGALSGFPGDIEVFEYNTFDVTGIFVTECTIVNNGDYDITCYFPAIEGYKWANALSGAPYPQIIEATGVAAVSLEIQDLSLYSTEEKTIIGGWEGTDGRGGNFNCDLTFIL